MPLKVRVSDNIENCRDQWNTLFKSLTNPSVFSSCEYAELWYRSFADPPAVRVVKAFDGEALVGVLPLVIRRKGPLRVLGSLTNDHCMHSEPLVAEECHKPFMSAISEWICTPEKKWDYLQYDYTYSYSSFPGLIEDEYPTSDTIRYERYRIPTYVVYLESSFEDYYHKTVNKSTRHKLNAAMKRMNKEKSWEFIPCHGSEALSRWETFLCLEDSGWKGEGKSSIAKLPQKYRDFYRGFLGLLEAKGMLVMNFLVIDGKYVAGNFGFTDRQIYYIAKSGYDPIYNHYSPSNILRLLSIKEISKKTPLVRMVHLYPGDYGYKHRMSSGVESCYSLRIYNSTAAGQAFNILRRMKRVVTNRTRRVSLTLRH
jgi:CelD/BcsL family acetyltransferase involved in cellulose biosynthesis